MAVASPAINYTVGQMPQLLRGQKADTDFDEAHRITRTSLGLLGELAHLEVSQSSPLNAEEEALRQKKLQKLQNLSRDPFELLQALTGTTMVIAQNGLDGLKAHKAFLRLLNTKAIKSLHAQDYVGDSSRISKNKIRNAFIKAFLGCQLSRPLLLMIEQIPNLLSSPMGLFLPKRLWPKLEAGKRYRRRFDKAIGDFLSSHQYELLEAMEDESNQGYLINVLRKLRQKGIPFDKMHEQIEVKSALVSVFPAFNLGKIIDGMLVTLKMYKCNPLVKELCQRIKTGQPLTPVHQNVINAIVQYSVAKYSDVMAVPRYSPSSVSDLGIHRGSVLSFPVKRRFLPHQQGYRPDANFEVLLDSPKVKAMVIEPEEVLSADHRAFILGGGIILRKVPDTSPECLDMALFDFRVIYKKGEQLITTPEVCSFNSLADLFDEFQLMDNPGQVLRSKPLGQIPLEAIEHFQLAGILPEFSISDYGPTEALRYDSITAFGVGPRQCPAKNVMMKLIKEAAIGGLTQLAKAQAAAQTSEMDYLKVPDFRG